jgi:hypothetical protein
MVGMVIFSIIGLTLVKMIMSQSRFIDQQEAWRNARSVARSGLNRMYSDLRMVEATGGLESAVAGGKDFIVRVPYAFGVVCSSAGTTTTLSLMPVDSAMFAGAGFAGMAWRSSAGVYTYVSGLGLNTSGTTANCTGASISTLASFNGSPAGRVVNVTGTVSPAPPAGSIAFLYRRVRYQFAASTILPGRTALWRTVQGGSGAEELATPFDTTSRVNFFVLNNSTAQAAVPSPLSNTRGLELKLDGMAERVPRGSPTPKISRVATAVYFENRPD